MNKLSEKLGLETWDIGAYAGTDAELLDMLSSSNGWDNDYDGGYVEQHLGPILYNEIKRRNDHE